MRIGFIGSGAMVSAIARGAASGGVDSSQFIFTDQNFSSAQALANELGATAYQSNPEVAESAELLVLGVKPHVQTSVLQEITPCLTQRGITVASIAAGRTIDAIAADIPSSIGIIRLMPNVNAQINQSMTALCARGASDADIAAITELMEANGRCITLPEPHFPAFQAIASCSPAWVFQIIDTLARAGVKHGLTKQDSVMIAAQSLLGSAQLVLNAQRTGQVPTQLIDQVTSPGGTTIAGLLAAEEAGLNTALIHAVDAAIARDAQLA